MTRVPLLSDEIVRLALEPRPGVRAPVELLDDIMREVRAMPRSSSVLGRWTRVAIVPRGRLAWILVAAGAILALVGAVLLAGGAPRQRPAFAEPTFGGALSVHLLGVGPEEAWVATYEGYLWHRTADGWTGSERIGADSVRDLAVLPDGRVVVVGDQGTRIRGHAGDWTWLGAPGAAVAVDAAGTLWVSGLDGDGRGLAAYRQAGAGWERTWIPCPAGGMRLAIASDGSVWTGGIGYSGTTGLARWDGERCDAIFPTEDLFPEVIGLGAGPDGMVAIGISIELPGDEFSGETLLWDGSTWSRLREDPTAGPWKIAFGPDGALYATDPFEILRYRDGTWRAVVADAHYAQLSITPDGTLWYARNLTDNAVTIGHIALEEIPD